MEIDILAVFAHPDDMELTVGGTLLKMESLGYRTGTLDITQGADNIGTYNKTPHSYRKWCRTCGGHLFTEHPGMGLIDIYAAVITDFPYEAGVHVHYAESALPMKDGLPKLRDFPAHAGGSGETLPE